jgi:hypothetical protein
MTVTLSVTSTQLLNSSKLQFGSRYVVSGRSQQKTPPPTSLLLLRAYLLLQTLHAYRPLRNNKFSLNSAIVCFPCLLLAPELWFEPSCLNIKVCTLFYVLPCTSHSSHLLVLNVIIIFCDEYKLWSFYLCDILHSSIASSLLGQNILISTLF